MRRQVWSLPAQLIVRVMLRVLSACAVPLRGPGRPLVCPWGAVLCYTDSAQCRIAQYSPHTLHVYYNMTWHVMSWNDMSQCYTCCPLLQVVFHTSHAITIIRSTTHTTHTTIYSMSYCIQFYSILSYSSLQYTHSLYHRSRQSSILQWKYFHNKEEITYSITR